MNRWQTRDDLLNLIAKNEIRLDQWRIFKDTRSQSNKRIELNLHSFRPSNVIELRYNYVTFIELRVGMGDDFTDWMLALFQTDYPRLLLIQREAYWSASIFGFQRRWRRLDLLQSCNYDYVGRTWFYSSHVELDSRYNYLPRLNCNRKRLLKRWGLGPWISIKRMNLKKKRKKKEKKIDSNVIT